MKRGWSGGDCDEPGDTGNPQGPPEHSNIIAKHFSGQTKYAYKLFGTQWHKFPTYKFVNLKDEIS